MQIEHYIFVGEYEDTVGTCVIFEEVESNGNIFKGFSIVKSFLYQRFLKFQIAHVQLDFYSP